MFRRNNRNNNPNSRMRVSLNSGRNQSLCNHVFSRGPRQGQSCPDIVCINSNEYCRTHYNQRVRRSERRGRRESGQQNEELLVNLLDNLIDNNNNIDISQLNLQDNIMHNNIEISPIRAEHPPVPYNSVSVSYDNSVSASSDNSVIDESVIDESIELSSDNSVIDESIEVLLLPPSQYMRRIPHIIEQNNSAVDLTQLPQRPQRPQRPHRQRRRQRNRRLPPLILPTFTDLFEEEKMDIPEFQELLYKSCSVCTGKVEGSMVKLECGCEYHLNCYILIHNEENCLQCGDKINKKEEDYPDCSICLEKIKINKVKTNCGHLFHRDCINSWIRIGSSNNDKCPNCRQDIH